MHTQKLETLSKALRLCLLITFVVGAAATVSLPWLLRVWFGDLFVNDLPYYRACVALLIPAGICTLFILWQMTALLKTVDRRDPFVYENVRGLRRIAICAFILSALFAALVFFRATILTAGVAYIFLVAGFCCVVLTELFRRAVAYKNENDLTV